MVVIQEGGQSLSQMRKSRTHPIKLQMSMKAWRTVEMSQKMMRIIILILWVLPRKIKMRK